jgi:hypothetical protein
VLVESFEPGGSVAAFMAQPHPQNTQIVALGVDTYLKMLLEVGGWVGVRARGDAVGSSKAD